MADRAELNFNTQRVDRTTRAVRQATREATSAGSRILNPRGATSGGGGRGGFKGALKDFVQRDEIMGRTGTISRLALAGNVAGTLLAFQSIEELARNVLSFAKGDASFAQVVQNQIKFLVPSVLREQIPELLKLAGVIPDDELIGRQLAKDWRAARREPEHWEIDPLTGRRRLTRPAWLREGTGEWGAARWRGSADYRRLLGEANERGVR